MFTALILSAILVATGPGENHGMKPCPQGMSSRERVYTVHNEDSGNAPGDRILEMIPETETGTGLPELIEYQLPAGYSPNGSSYPLIVCWHGYGQSCMSVAVESLIDEECLARDWIFLSITGANQVNYGSLVAQTHCTVAIRYLIDVLDVHIDPSRIYMAGVDMGAFGAADYAARHLDMEDGYPVAGLALVAPWYDLTDTYHHLNPSERQVLIDLLGGTPQQVPFAYRRLSTMFMDNGGYVLDQSFGMNLGHNAPIHISYAGNHPLEYITTQNEVFIDMLGAIGANTVVDYQAVSPTPTSWALLDEKAAFDFIAPYSLATQQTGSIRVLADREAWFYWLKADQIEADTFALMKGSIESTDNRLEIGEATHTDAIGVDCTGRLDDEKPLRIGFQSSHGVDQWLNLSPLPTKPTYLVDLQGKLFSEWTYASGTMSVSCPANEFLDIKASFEPYDLSLAATPEQVHENDLLTLALGNGDPYDPFALFFAIDQIETKVGNRHLLVSLQPPTCFWIHGLDAAGELLLLDPSVDPMLVNLTFYLQFATFDHGIKAFSNLAMVEVIE